MSQLFTLAYFLSIVGHTGVCLCISNPPSMVVFVSVCPHTSCRVYKPHPLSLRYQSSSKPGSPSQKQLPPTDLSHSVSMDVPKELTPKTPPANAGRVPRSKSAGDSGRLKAVHHLTPPIDRHRAGRKKTNKTGKLTILNNSKAISSIY